MNDNKHNFHELYYDEGNYRCRSEAYEIQVDDTYLSEENPYIKSLLESANLKIMQPKMVKKEYEERKELGLFNLFFSPDLTQGIFSWTKKKLEAKGSYFLTMDLLHSYLGIEIAMSLMRCNNIYDYWSHKKFFGSHDIKSAMSRNMFTKIRSSLGFYPMYDDEVASKDPLWHSRVMMEHFLKNATSIAVPEGPVALDENTIRCKAMTRAKTYIKNKPVKFGIRFYAVVGWHHHYLYSLWDNGSGNRIKTTPASKYCQLFPTLRSIYQQKFVLNEKSPIPAEKPSALWCLQLAHMHHKFELPQDKKRIVFMDNFYTRHVLGKQIKSLTNDEIRIIGTVRMNFVDKLNKPNVKKAYEMVEKMVHGSWLLVQCFDSGPDGDPQVSTNCGYLVFKDKKVVVFYSNDLADTPREIISGVENDHTVECVHGLSKIKRWLGKEVFHRTILRVPAIVVAYNIFMNSVDRFDQYRKTNELLRREKRVNMSIFTFLIDASINNAYALFRKLFPEKKISMTEFKRRIAEQLVSKSRQGSDQDSNTTTKDTKFVPFINHQIIQNKDKKRQYCYLCKIMTNEKKDSTTKKKNIKQSAYSCVQCQKCFCVNCFTGYHHLDELHDNRPELAKIIESREAYKRTHRIIRDCKIKYTNTLKEMKFSFEE